MNLSSFCCPEWGGPLNIGEADLSCPSCPREYAVVGSVPDFFVGDLEQDFIQDPNRTWLDPEIVAARDTVYRLCARQLMGMAYCMEEIYKRCDIGTRILEVGMGTGHFTLWLGEMLDYETEIYAFDYSWPIIEKAKANTQGINHITMFRANARGPLPLQEGSFDIVFIRLAPLGERGVPKIQAAYQLLKPGGWYFDAGWEKTEYKTGPTEWALQNGYDRAQHHVWQYYRTQTEEEREAWQIEQAYLAAMGCESAQRDQERYVYEEGAILRKMTIENLLIAQKPFTG